MLKVNFYEEVDDDLLKFAVIVSKYYGQWVFCKIQPYLMAKVKEAKHIERSMKG